MIYRWLIGEITRWIDVFIIDSHHQYGPCSIACSMFQSNEFILEDGSSYVLISSVISLVGGVLWCTYPSEKSWSERQLGLFHLIPNIWEKMFQTTKQIYYIIDITWYNTKMGSAPVRSFPDFGVNELIRAVLAPTCADQFCLTTQGWPVPVPALPFLVKLLAALRWSRPFWSLTLEHLHYIMAERTCLGAPKNMFKQWWQKISI